MISKTFGLSIGLAVAGLVLVGCSPKAPTGGTGGAGGASSSGSGSKSSTAYHPQHGLDNGHLFDIDTESFKAQWHQSSKHHRIDVKFLDSEGKSYQPAKVDAVTVRSTARTDGMEWQLEPGERNENGEVAGFSLDNEELHRAMTLGIRVEFKCGDDVFSAVVPAHTPHMHD